MDRPFQQLWWALAFMACAAVVAGAFEAGSKLWDQTTAAWVQALGTLGAIFVVFLIDRRTAARLARDKAAEAELRRRERWDARNHTEHVRLSVIFKASQAFAETAVKMRGAAANGEQHTKLPPEMQQRIRGAEGAINALLAQPSDASPEVLVALSMAAQAIGHWRARAEAEQPIAGVAAHAGYLNLLKDAQHALAGIYEEGVADRRAAEMYANED